MSHQWQPGDVALVEVGCWANRKVALRLDEGWAHTDGDNHDGDGVVSPIRPLVVIDPEDCEQVERFMRFLPDDWCLSGFTDFEQDTHDLSVGQVQAALREFANPEPPKCSATLSLAGDLFQCDGRAGHPMPHASARQQAYWDSPDA